MTSNSNLVSLIIFNLTTQCYRITTESIDDAIRYILKASKKFLVIKRLAFLQQVRDDDTQTPARPVSAFFSKRQGGAVTQ